MTYELAKELKEAGFLQVQPHSAHTDFKDCTNPTLSELIEACGEPLTLQIMRNYTFVILHGPDLQADGVTPEEAVAMLWLALNTKAV